MSARGDVVGAVAVLLRGRPMEWILAKRRLLAVGALDEVMCRGDNVVPQLEPHRLRRARRGSGYPVGGDMLDRVAEDSAHGAVGIVGVAHPAGVDEFRAPRQHD